jgi:hypothetical protein
LSKANDRAAQEVSLGAARCASQVLDLEAKAVTRGSATLLQQAKNNSQDTHIALGELESLATALSHVSAAITLPVPAAQNFGVGLKPPCWEQAFSRRREAWQMYCGTE